MASSLSVRDYRMSGWGDDVAALCDDVNANYTFKHTHTMIECRPCMHTVASRVSYGMPDVLH